MSSPGSERGPNILFTDDEDGIPRVGPTLPQPWSTAPVTNTEPESSLPRTALTGKPQSSTAASLRMGSALPQRVVASTLGQQLAAFDPTHPEYWGAWVAQLKHFLNIWGETNTKLKKSWLLSTCSIAMIWLAQNLVMPKMLETATYEELLTTLTNYYIPKSLKWAIQMDFQACMQKSGDPTTEFLADLRHLTSMCQAMQPYGHSDLQSREQ
ncbi:UNVERIFIED_CONTAM: hypothetical protein K2H54_036780 [Gekko kuhli]